MERKKAFILVLIFALGLGLRLFPVQTGYHYWDETVYLQHGEILSGNSPNNYNEFDFRPPLFSLILGATFLMVNSTTAAHVVVAFLSSIGILLTYLLGKEIYDYRTGIAAALIYTFSPLAIKHSHDILVDSILPIFWLSAAYFFWKALDVRKRNYYVLTGFFAALAVLMKFTSLALMPILALLMLLKSRYGGEEWIGAVKTELYRRNNWLLLGAFGLTMLPYLVFSYIAYGSPIYVFTESLRLSGATDYFSTYLIGLPMFLMSPFLLGVLIYLLDFEELKKFRNLFLTILTVSFVLIMQFVIGNKELRFLLPVVPMVSIMAAQGFRKIDFGKNKAYYLLVSLVILFSVPFLHDELNHRSPFQLEATVDNWHPPVEDASIWLKNNTPEDTVVYTNYQYPALGYYSKREIVWIHEYRPLDELVNEMPEPGYVYYSKNSPYPHPSLEELQNDDRFLLNKTFDNTVYLFYFKGR